MRLPTQNGDDADTGGWYQKRRPVRGRSAASYGWALTVYTYTYLYIIYIYIYICIGIILTIVGMIITVTRIRKIAIVRIITIVKAVKEQ